MRSCQAMIGVPSTLWRRAILLLAACDGSARCTIVDRSRLFGEQERRQCDARVVLDVICQHAQEHGLSRVSRASDRWGAPAYPRPSACGTPAQRARGSCRRFRSCRLEGWFAQRRYRRGAPRLVLAPPESEPTVNDIEREVFLHLVLVDDRAERSKIWG